MITTGYKEYSDSYLMSLTKKDIIKQLRCAEHNFRATEQMFNQHMENVKDWQPVVHAHWVKYDRFCCSSDGTPLIKIAEEYECSKCGRVASDPEPYCHCGAKMDEEVEDE